MSDLNIAFDRYASIGTVMHYILVISLPIDQKYGMQNFEKEFSLKVRRYFLTCLCKLFFRPRTN